MGVAQFRPAQRELCEFEARFATIFVAINKE